MRRNVIGTLGASLFTAVSFAVNFASAQPVSVALGDGVHVRAPFVSVDVFPHGGVSVRAPFTAVDVGGRPVYGAPPVVVGRPIAQAAPPSPQELAAMDDETLLHSLRSTSAQLHDYLNRFDTATIWQRYLGLPSELATGANASLDEQRAATSKLIQRFRDVAADPRYGKIAKLSAFMTMQALLSELESRQAKASNGHRAEELPPPRETSKP